VSDSETDKDRAQELATELYGRGAAISEDQKIDGWDFIVWAADGRSVHKHSTNGYPLAEARLTLIESLEGMLRNKDLCRRCEQPRSMHKPACGECNRFVEDLAIVRERRSRERNR